MFISYFLDYAFAVLASTIDSFMFDWVRTKYYAFLYRQLAYHAVILLLSRRKRKFIQKEVLEIRKMEKLRVYFFCHFLVWILGGGDC